MVSYLQSSKSRPPRDMGRKQGQFRPFTGKTNFPGYGIVLIRFSVQIYLLEKFIGKKNGGLIFKSWKTLYPEVNFIYKELALRANASKLAEIWQYLLCKAFVWLIGTFIIYRYFQWVLIRIIILAGNRFAIWTLLLVIVTLLASSSGTLARFARSRFGPSGLTPLSTTFYSLNNPSLFQLLFPLSTTLPSSNYSSFFQLHFFLSTTFLSFNYISLF